MLDIMLPNNHTKNNHQHSRNITVPSQSPLRNGHNGYDSYSISPDLHPYMENYHHNRSMGGRGGEMFHTVSRAGGHKSSNVHVVPSQASRASPGVVTSTPSSVRELGYSLDGSLKSRASPLAHLYQGNPLPSPFEPKSTSQSGVPIDRTVQHVGYAHGRKPPSPIMNHKSYQLYQQSPPNGLPLHKVVSEPEQMLRSMANSQGIPAARIHGGLGLSHDTAVLQQMIMKNHKNSPASVMNSSKPSAGLQAPADVYHATPVNVSTSRNATPDAVTPSTGRSYHRSNSESQDRSGNYVTLDDTITIYQQRHRSIAVPHTATNDSDTMDDIPQVNQSLPTNAYMREARKILLKTQYGSSPVHNKETDVRTSFPQPKVTQAPSLGSSYPFTSIQKTQMANEESGDTNSVSSSTETPLSLNTSDSSDLGNNGSKKKSLLKPLQTIKENLLNKKSKNSSKPLFKLKRSNSTPDVLEENPADEPEDDYGFLSSRYQYRSFRQKSRFSENETDELSRPISSVMQQAPRPTAEHKEQSPSGVKLLSKKWRKSKTPAVKSTPSQWKPEGTCRWSLVAQDDVTVELKPQLLLHLTEVEHTTLQKISLAKLQTMGLGCPVTIPKTGNLAKRSKSTRFTLKKKQSSNQLTVEKGKENKDSKDTTSAQLVFGIPLAKVICNDVELKLLQSAENKDPAIPARKSSISSGMGSDADSLNTSSGLLDTNGLDHPEKVHPHVPQVPYILTACCRHIEQYGLEVEGIFRKGGSKKRVAELRQAFNSGVKVELGEDLSPHDVACLLKEWLRELPDPLLTKDLFLPFTATRKLSNDHQRLSALRLLVCLLPSAHQDSLHVLMTFLDLVSQHSNQIKDPVTGQLRSGNRMDVRNLTTVFGPNLLHRTNNTQPIKMDQHDKMEDPNQVIGVVCEILEHYNYLFMVSPELQDEVLRTLMDTDPQSLDGILNQLHQQQRLGSSTGSGSASATPDSGIHLSPVSSAPPYSSPASKLRPNRTSAVTPQQRLSVPVPQLSKDLPVSPYVGTRKSSTPQVQVTPGSPLVSIRRTSRLQRSTTADNPELLSVPLSSRSTVSASLEARGRGQTKDLLVSSNSSLSSGYHGSGNLSRSRTASPAPELFDSQGHKFYRTSSLQRPLGVFPTKSHSLEVKGQSPKLSVPPSNLPTWQRQRWEHWEHETRERSEKSNEQETLV